MVWWMSGGAPRAGRGATCVWNFWMNICLHSSMVLVPLALSVGWLVGVVWRFWLAACFFLRLLLLLLLCVRHPHPFRHLLARCPGPPATRHPPPAVRTWRRRHCHEEKHAHIRAWMDGWIMQHDPFIIQRGWRSHAVCVLIMLDRAGISALLLFNLQMQTGAVRSARFVRGCQLYTPA